MSESVLDRSVILWGNQMTKKIRLSAVAVAAVCMFLVPAQGAFADDSALTPEGQKVLETFNAPPTSGSAVPKPSKVGKSDLNLMSVASRRASHYNGSWLVYTEMNVDFYFDWTRVVSSYGFQNTGAIGLNTVQALGIANTYTTNWEHNWRAQTDIGIGAPTPWGSLNVTHYTRNQYAVVYGDGAWRAWQ